MISTGARSCFLKDTAELGRVREKKVDHKESGVIGAESSLFLNGALTE